jgi:hypothetical protein
MGQQHLLAVQVDDDRVIDQAHATADRKTAPEQKVAIAMHHIAGDPALGQTGERVADPVAIRFAIIIADPGFEQVAQDIECRGVAGPSRQKVHELCSGRRLAGIQV